MSAAEAAEEDFASNPRRCVGVCSAPVEAGVGGGYRWHSIKESAGHLAVERSSRDDPIVVMGRSDDQAYVYVYVCVCVCVCAYASTRVCMRMG